jgi:hypothetical protein
MTRNTLWGEGATRNVVLVDTETCAESAQSIERRDGNASQVEVKESLAHLVIGLYARGGCIAGDIGLKKIGTLRLVTRKITLKSIEPLTRLT